MIKEQIKRLYKVADAYMIQFAKALRLFFIDDQAQFVAEDSNFNSPYETNWNDAIVDAENEPTDEQRKDQLKQLTNNVEAEMELSRDVFQAAKRYIIKAFPDRPNVRKEFGFDDYEESSRSQAKFIPFMTRFHATAVKYTSELTAPAVNYSQTRIDAIATRRDALNTANNTQEKFKGSMLAFTEQRIIKLNNVWKINTEVAGVGKMIFKKVSYAKYQNYLLPPSEEPSGTLVLSGTLTDVNTTNPVSQAVATLQPHGLQSTSDSNGMYGFGNAPAGAATLNITHPLYNTENIAVVIDPNNPLVLDVVLTPSP